MERSASRFPRHRALACLLVLGGASFALAACGSGDADLANGKAKFAACGGCHTLADAGTTGDPITGGPNLDDAFRAARRQGFEPSSFEGIIRYWIKSPEQRSKPIMPADIVTGKDADDVAAYVASVAGRDAESPARPAEPTE